MKSKPRMAGLATWAFLGCLCLYAEGCGTLLMRAPPRDHERRTSFSCTERDILPVFDIVMGTYWALLGTSDEAGPGDAAIGFRIGAVFGLSAAHGFYKSRRCRRALQQLGERQALLRSAAAPAVAYAVVVSPPGDTLTIGERIQLVATAHRSSGAVVSRREFVWSSSDSTVASVSNAGLVSAHSAGSVTIGAKTGNLVGTASIVVAAPR